jgi:septum formation protein
VPAPLILASSSPRRRALLAQAGYKFQVISPAVSEIAPSYLSLRELTIANATRKALAVFCPRPDRIVLAADTLVALRGKIIGKPCDLNHARVILRQLSGRVHEVCTAVLVIGPKKRKGFVEISRVRFRKLSARDITKYLRVVNPIDKAGAYAAQGVGRRIISSITGSVTNVIGLPVEQTIQVLAQFGLRPANVSRRSLSATA